uniref:Phosphatidylinositol transfer protein N-terminal domain-containing protein n=1 Tax=Periophthalmus magnuspinnatus TaxID=409849 RepID=A0A3B4AZ15_9GOBI
HSCLTARRFGSIPGSPRPFCVEFCMFLPVSGWVSSGYSGFPHQPKHERPSRQLLFKLPSWARAVVPRIFYVTEKAWNYYPYTITGNSGFGHNCSFLPKFSIHIETKYEDNKGTNDHIFGGEPREDETEVCMVDIAYDEVPERHYKESEDLRYFQSKKTNRGLLPGGWMDTQDPIMCSYKLVTVKFEVWGLQTRVEQFVHKVIRDVLLLGHRQAFAWIDEWIGEN